MIQEVFLYLLLTIGGLLLMYLGYERGSVILVMVGSIIATIGIVGGMGIITYDLQTQIQEGSAKI